MAGLLVDEGPRGAEAPELGEQLQGVSGDLLTYHVGDELPVRESEAGAKSKERLWLFGRAPPEKRPHEEGE